MKAKERLFWNGLRGGEVEGVFRCICVKGCMFCIHIMLYGFLDVKEKLA